MEWIEHQTLKRAVWVGVTWWRLKMKILCKLPISDIEHKRRTPTKWPFT